MHRHPIVCAAASMLLIFALPALALPAAQNAAPSAVTGKSGAVPILTVRGDQVSTEDLVDAVAKAFAATGEGRLEVTPFNTVEAIDAALSGRVDIAASARPAYPRHAKESELTFTPVAWDALVLITGASNPVNNLTLRQVHQIYYGKITNWSQLGGADQPIDLDGVASPLDGVQFSFRRLLFGNGDIRVPVPQLFINIDSLQSEVSLNENALAVSTMSHARRQKGIKALAIEGVTPSLTTLESGRYPLPLAIYLAYRPDNPKLPEINKFLAFLRGTTAGSTLRRHGLVPYEQATVLDAGTETERINLVGAYLVSEGLPANDAPGTEFARLAGSGQEIARAAALEQAAAKVVARQKAAAAQAAAAAPEPPPPKQYTVKKGDTLSGIASKYSVSVQELKTWNHLHSSLLQIGQVLKVSAPSGQ
jgi:phosphate transport system substrate-binding protein